MLHIYLQDIARYRPLTLLQEQSLAQAARQGDTEARNQLIQSHLRMVVHIARQYLRPSVEMLDLIQEGNIGLIRAVDTFDPTQGHRLSTLAFYWINKHIQQYLDNEPHDLVSLDIEINDGAATLLLSDTIEDKGTILGGPTIPHIDAVMENEERQRQVRQMWSHLSERERKVLRLLYGIDLRRSYTVSEVARMLRVSKVRVCQLRDRTLERMHNSGMIKSQ